MDVIGHYYEGVQIVLVEFGIAKFEALADAFGDAGVFQPERARLGAIEVLVGFCKFLAGRQGSFGAQFLQYASWQGSVETPSEKDWAVFGEPVGKIAMVIGQGRMDLA